DELAGSASADGIGVLSTAGSYHRGLWRTSLRAAGLSVIDVVPEMAEKVHDAIYHPRFGLKAVQPPTAESKAVLFTAIKELISKGADTLVLGCTELPFVQREIEIEFGDRIELINPIEC